MTTLEMSKAIGTVYSHSFNGLTVRVQVLDVKIAYNIVKHLVKVEGQDSNAIWINA